MASLSYLLVHSACNLVSKALGVWSAFIFFPHDKVGGFDAQIVFKIPIQLAELSPPAFRATVGIGAL